MTGPGPTPSAPQDTWLDRAPAAATPPDQSTASPVFRQVSHAAATTLTGPLQVLRRTLSFLGTSPGKLFTVIVILTLAITAAGISMSNSSASRQENLNELLSTTEPMSNAAHQLYTSLSEADAYATTGFVQAGVQSESMRRAYDEAIDNAAVAATESVLGTSPEDQRIRDLVGLIQRELPTYTGMVEATRANHRAGNAVSEAYMSNASALMRDDLLPAADELFRLTSMRVSEQQKQLTSPQWVPLSGLIAAVIFLILAQWWLWRLTRRRFNRGFLTATGLITLAIVWVVFSNLATWSAGSQGFAEASRPWDMLTSSRIEAQRAYSAETLSLVQRYSLEDLSDSFHNTSEDIAAALDEFDTSKAIGGDTAAEEADSANLVDKARRDLSGWQSSHERFTTALSDGDYDEAVRQATAATPQPGEQATSASAFRGVDSSLDSLIKQSRASMRAYIQEGLSAMTMVASAVFILTVLAIFSIWLGIRPRLQEYL